MNSNDDLYLLSNKDIEQLAQFLTNLLGHFNRYRFASEEAFLINLHIIADCYRLILLNKGEEVPLDERLKVFTHYFDLKTAEIALEKVALAISEMIHLVSDQVRLLSQPWFYSAYLFALNHLLDTKRIYLHASISQGMLLRKKLLKTIGRSA